MKLSSIKTVGLILMLLLLTLPPAAAEDMRELPVQARLTREKLKQKAINEKKDADAAARANRALIRKNRSALKKNIAQLETDTRQLKLTIAELTKTAQEQQQRETELTQKLTETDKMIKELVGIIRINANHVDTLINQNLQSAVNQQPTAFLININAETRFPGMDDVRNLAVVLQQQIKLSSEVGLRNATIINRAGTETSCDILLLGPFTAAYRNDSEVGFLNYSTSSGKLYALSRLPATSLRKQLTRYMEGKSETVPIDISRGAALRKLTHELNLGEQIPKGGPIVWPIMLILGLGILITLERSFFLLRNHLNVDTLFPQVENAVNAGDWLMATRICKKAHKKPIARVLLAALPYHKMPREEIENTLQEAILKEIPAMERFLSTLGMLAAIAPLLGLLGTVTGMIDTFHVITLYGTGDPRLMSGGISEALVTTMLGLAVAIPLMVAQTLLNRTVEKRIGLLEEKAVALVNIIDKNRIRS
jgi:biopolymer transport protein ExbB